METKTYPLPLNHFKDQLPSTHSLLTVLFEELVSEQIFVLTDICLREVHLLLSLRYHLYTPSE